MMLDLNTTGITCNDDINLAHSLLILSLLLDLAAVNLKFDKVKMDGNVKGRHRKVVMGVDSCVISKPST